MGSSNATVPAPLASGERRWSKVPLSAANAADWLRSLVGDADGPKGSDLGTHSLKVTLLSWAAKFGMAIELRRALGYHSAGKDLSVLTYSRDAMSEPLRALQEVIDAVAANQFNPDARRSGYFRGGNSRDVEADSDGSSETSFDEEDRSHGSPKCCKWIYSWAKTLCTTRVSVGSSYLIYNEGW